MKINRLILLGVTLGILVGYIGANIYIANSDINDSGIENNKDYEYGSCHGTKQQVESDEYCRAILREVENGFRE